jgi:SAM-dependent methyltransferase
MARRADRSGGDGRPEQGRAPRGSSPERVRAEGRFHDHEAAHFERRRPYLWEPESLDIVTTLEQMGAVQGLRILDIGCGRGDTTLFFANHGALACGLDVSKGSLDFVRRSADVLDVPGVDACLGSAEDMPFGDGSFDAVFGRGALHHLDIERALVEIGRVLRPGGKGVFLEPLDVNHLLRVYRWLTAWTRVRGHRALLRSDIEEFCAGFEEYKLIHFGLLAAVPAKVFKHRRWVVLRWLDRWLFDRFPALRSEATFVCLVVDKRVLGANHVGSRAEPGG